MACESCETEIELHLPQPTARFAGTSMRWHRAGVRGATSPSVAGGLVCIEDLVEPHTGWVVDLLHHLHLGLELLQVVGCDSEAVDALDGHHLGVAGSGAGALLAPRLPHSGRLALADELVPLVEVLNNLQVGSKHMRRVSMLWWRPRCGQGRPCSAHARQCEY